MNTCKISFLYALAISLLVTTAEARQLECSYDYVTHKTVYKITEGNDGNGNLDYSWHRILGSGGKDEWFFKEQPPTKEIKSDTQYVKMWENMYSNSNGDWIPDIAYISFEKVKFYQIQRMDFYLKDAEMLPHGYVKSNRTLTIPVILWDCKRLD